LLKAGFAQSGPARERQNYRRSNARHQPGQSILR
jgi:hypothetical protein